MGDHDQILQHTIFKFGVICCMLSMFYVSSIITHHKLWPTSPTSGTNHFSFNSSLGLAGGKHYQKITLQSFKLFFKILLFRVVLLAFFSFAIFSPYDLFFFQSSKLIIPLCAKFFGGNKHIYSHFISCLNIDMTQVVEILPQVRQELAYYMYYTQSISRVLMPWRRKDQGHQQPWYWLLIWSPYLKA